MKRPIHLLALGLLAASCASSPDTRPTGAPEEAKEAEETKDPTASTARAGEVQPHQQIVRRTGELRRRIAERCLSRHPTEAPVDGELVVLLDGEGEPEMVSLQFERDPDLSVALEACITDDVASWGLPTPRTRKLKIGWKLRLDGAQVELARPHFSLYLEGALRWEDWQPIHSESKEVCIDAAWDAGEHGDILVEYDIAADGRVTRVEIPESDVRSEKVLACLRRRYATKRFPKAAGATYVLAPVRLLSPEEMEARKEAWLAAKPAHWAFRWQLREYEKSLRECAELHPIDELRMGTLEVRVSEEGMSEASIAWGVVDAAPDTLGACLVERANAWDLPKLGEKRWLMSLEIDVGPGGLALYPPNWRSIVDGGLGFDDVLGEAAPELAIDSCIEGIEPGDETRFAFFDYTIGADGSVLQVDMWESSLRRPEAEACVARVIAETVYPASSGATYVQLPLAVRTNEEKAWMAQRLAAKRAAAATDSKRE